MKTVSMNPGHRILQRLLLTTHIVNLYLPKELKTLLLKLLAAAEAVVPALVS